MEALTKNQRCDQRAVRRRTKNRPGGEIHKARGVHRVKFQARRSYSGFLTFTQAMHDPDL